MNKALDALVAAANRYGDAKAANEAIVRTWKPGDPPPTSCRLLEGDLLSAARKLATSTRAARRRASS